MHLRSPPQLQSQNPLEGRLPRDYSRSIPISQTPWSIMHPSAWKVNSPKLDFRFTEFSEVQVHSGCRKKPVGSSACPQCSTILPWDMRNMSIALTSTRLPVGAIP